MSLRRPPAAGTLVLAVVTVAAAGLAAGPLRDWPGVVHLVALPPLDLAADLRWIVAWAPSWPLALLAGAASLAVRTALLAALLGGRRPRWGTALRLHLVAWPALLLAAELDVIGRSVLYARLAGAAVVILVLVVLLLAAAPWTGADRIRTGIRSAAGDGFRAGELAGYLAVLVVLGTVAELVPAAAPLCVVLSAAATWVTVARLRAPAPRHARRHAAATVTIGVAALVAATVTRMDTPHVSSATREVDVLIASGINSSSGQGAIFGVEPERLGVSCDEMHYFSYAGRGDGQPQGDAACPKYSGAPYEPEDTQRPFAEQVALLTDQIGRLDGPVVVLAHSQAAWVAWEVAARGEVPQLDTVVLVGPFPSSPLGYPPPGERGAGRVGGDLLRVLVPLTTLVDFDFVVDAPLSRELLASPDAATQVWESGPPADVRVLAVTTSADLLLMPDGWRIEGADDACPVRAPHPDVPDHGDFHRVVDGYLDGRLDGGCGPGPELLRAATQAFGAPSPPR
ncbi:hypothetical protein FTX61_10665 [Nitriliruptoraceae bacterium ZYF776]|nr:hypothetical protein [Profundirhabdus halotolerans]